MGEQERGPEEQKVIDRIAQRRGREWAEEHADLLIAQARLIGDIPGEEDSPDEGIIPDEGNSPDEENRPTEGNNPTDIREKLEDGYLFELTYRESGSEKTILATYFEITRPSAKPLDGTPVFGFRSIAGEERFRLRASEIVAVHPISIENVAGLLRRDATEQLLEAANEGPGTIPLSDAATLLGDVETDADSRKQALTLARRLLQENDRGPEVLSTPILDLLTEPEDGANAEKHWSRSAYGLEATACIALLAEDDPASVFDLIPQLAIAGETGNVETRRWAMYALSRVADEFPEELFPALQVLLDGIGTDDDSIRTNALSALGRIVSEYPDEGVPIAGDLAALLDSTEPGVRANAVGLLGDLAREHPAVVMRYASAIARRLTDSESDARRNASIALLRAGEANPQAIRDEATQLKAALYDDLTEVRRNACSLIGNAEPSVSTDRLRELSTDDPDEIVRDRAGWALERLE